MSEFWNKELLPGYYDFIVEKGLAKKRGIRSYWHITTLQNVLKYINYNSKHLDYACGPGTLIGHSNSKTSIGVDLSKNQILFANKKYFEKGKFFTIDQFELKEYSNKFNVITIIGLIEFLNDDEIIELINKLDNVLEIEGKIIITTPNFSGIMLFLEIIQNFFGKVNYKDQHINRFNKKKLSMYFHKFPNYEFEIRNLLNLSLIFSIFSHKFSAKIEKSIGKIFNHKFGSLFLIELIKKDRKCILSDD